MLTRTYGLQWHQNFASAHGKLSDNQYPTTGAAYRAAFATP